MTRVIILMILVLILGTQVAEAISVQITIEVDQQVSTLGGDSSTHTKKLAVWIFIGLVGIFVSALVWRR